MSRLPTPGSDANIWGKILNDFLNVEHNADGSLKLRTDPELTGKVDKSTLAFNVKDYGAVGDGASDDLAAIQKLIDSLGSNGGSIYFPPGKYNISGTLLLKEKLTVFGDSSASAFGGNIASSTIHCTSPNVNALDGTDLRTIHIHDIAITGMGKTSGTGGGISITHSSLATANNCIERVWVSDFGGNGVYINTPIVNNLYTVRVERVGGHGFMVENGTSIMLQTCYANSTGGAGFYLRSVAYSHLAACAADYNSVGYYLRACISLNLTGCGCEWPAAGGGYDGSSYYLYGGNGVSLINCHCIFNESYAFNILNAATKIVLVSPKESAPLAGAINSLKTATGTDVVVVAPAFNSPTSCAAGTYFEAGASTVTGSLAIGNPAVQGGSLAYVERSTSATALMVRSTYAAGNTAANIVSQVQAASGRVFQAGLQADSTNRLSIEGSGLIEWGSGSAVRDTNLYRATANVLRTDDTFNAAAYQVGALTGASGTFTSSDGKTITITNGLITGVS